MAINFPDSPNNGDAFTSNNKTWVFDGTVWNITSGTNSVADGAITAAKIASNAVTSDKITAGAVNQSKLGTTFSGITITTTANRDTDISSPFTGQFCFLTDTSTLQRYTGSAWVNAVTTTPAAPTALSATALGTTSVSVAFTPGADNGSGITNYQYALSTNSGSTYGAFTAVDPADATSPITISGLSAETAYTIKLKAVNILGAGAESTSVSVTTFTPLTVQYLVIAGGGGGGGNDIAGGGGAGGYRSSVVGENTGGLGAAENIFTPTLSTNYSVSVGAGGNGGVGAAQSAGSLGVDTIFATITSTGGGRGAAGGNASPNGGPGGSGAGGGGNNANSTQRTGGARTASPVQGFNGGAGTFSGTLNNTSGGSGGGAGAVGGSGGNNTNAGPGGIGIASSITGSSVTRAGGGAGGMWNGAGGSIAGGAGGGGGGSNGPGGAGTVNTGGGGGGAGTSAANAPGGAGGSGIVILRYPSFYTITLGAGLTGSTTTVSSDKVTTITAGSGNVSWA